MRRLSPMMMGIGVGLHPVEGRANDPGARLADIEGFTLPVIRCRWGRTSPPQAG